MPRLSKHTLGAYLASGCDRQLALSLAADALVPRLEIDATVEDEPEVAALTWLKTWENRL